MIVDGSARRDFLIRKMFAFVSRDGVLDVLKLFVDPDRMVFEMLCLQLLLFVLECHRMCCCLWRVMAHHLIASIEAVFWYACPSN